MFLKILRISAKFLEMIDALLSNIEFANKNDFRNLLLK